MDGGLPIDLVADLARPYLSHPWSGPVTAVAVWAWRHKAFKALEARVDALEHPTMTPEFIKSPNYTPGRFLMKPDKIVVHWMAGTLGATVSRFANPKSQVSAHFGIGRDGRTVQFVALKDTAWHAGNWLANLTSVGIEHEGAPDVPISDECYAASAALLRQVSAQTGIPITLRTVVPHKKFKATQCPGTLDINRLVMQASVPLPIPNETYDIAPAPARTVEVVPVFEGEVTADVLRVRDAPAGNVIDRLHKGDRLRFVDHHQEREMDGTKYAFYEIDGRPGNWVADIGFKRI